jgi:sporulation protein YlmC with PRC-barrel domain
MSKFLQKGIAALTLCVIAAPPVMAQNNQRDRAIRATAEMPDLWLFKASELIGKEVRNNADEKLGKIDEIALDITDGRIAYAVLSFGGFLGMGDKLFAVPWDALQLKPRDRTKDSELIFVFNVDKDRLKGAPGFDKNAWPDMADTTWSTGIHKYWEKESALRPNARTRAGERAGAVKQVRRVNKELTGRDVKNTRFEDVGDVNDLMVDVISGYAVYVIAQIEGKADATDEMNRKIDGDLVVLPWNALQLKPDEAKGKQDTFVINTDTKLHGVPAFHKREWPNMNDATWNQKVYKIYGIHAFWDDQRQVRSDRGD